MHIHGASSGESKGAFVNADPYEKTSFLMHIKYTILWRIWASMLFFTSISVMLVLLDRLDAGINLGIPSTMLTVLGTVLGFCISYRTSSAYERFIEGRKLWQQVHAATRMASRLIWFHCPSYTSKDIEPEKQELDAAKALLEKKTMLNLLEAFAVALKHYLRGESGIHYEDLYHLILFLPKYQLPNSTPIRRHDILHPDNSLGRSTQTSLGPSPDDSEIIEVKEDIPDSQPHIHFRRTTSPKPSDGPSDIGPRNPDKPLLPAHNPPPFNFIDDMVPALAPLRGLFKFGRKRVIALIDAEAAKKKKRKHKKDIYAGEAIPVELNMHFSAYIGLLQRRGTIDGPTVSALLAANAMLADALSGLERVLTTPIPFSYAIHLKHTAYLYLLFLPFQILAPLGYLSIPAVFVASFIFCGFLEIGDQIEQPLGYDSCDLDLGTFCANISKELHELAAMPAGDPEDFFFSHLNEPLAPADTRSAVELVQDNVDKSEVQRILRNGHEQHTVLARSFTQLQRSSTSEEAPRRNLPSKQSSYASSKVKMEDMV